jgi:hypothetical protein
MTGLTIYDLYTHGSKSVNAERHRIQLQIRKLKRKLEGPADQDMPEPGPSGGEFENLLHETVVSNCMQVSGLIKSAMSLSERDAPEPSISGGRSNWTHTELSLTSLYQQATSGSVQGDEIAEMSPASSDSEDNMS